MSRTIQISLFFLSSFISHLVSLHFVRPRKMELNICKSLFNWILRWFCLRMRNRPRRISWILFLIEIAPSHRTKCEISKKLLTESWRTNIYLRPDRFQFCKQNRGSEKLTLFWRYSRWRCVKLPYLSEFRAIKYGN